MNKITYECVLALYFSRLPNFVNVKSISNKGLRVNDTGFKLNNNDNNKKTLM